MEIFDVIVLGAGSAGVSAALRASDQGAHVCIIEQEKIGGSCIHKGLYPLKLGLGLLRNNESNFNVNGRIDSEKLFHKITGSMQLLFKLWEQRLTEAGVTIKIGSGLPLSSDLVQVRSNDKAFEIATKKIIIATGSSPVP